MATGRQQKAYQNREFDVTPKKMANLRRIANWPQWRRRESNESDKSHKHHTGQGVTDSEIQSAALGQRAGDSDCHQLTDDPRLNRIALVWADLPEHIKMAVEALCLQPASCDDQLGTLRPRDQRHLMIDDE